jgi:hypothetical protein
METLTPNLGPFRIVISDQPHHKLQLPNAERFLDTHYYGGSPILPNAIVAVLFHRTGGGLKANGTTSKV